MRQGCLAQAGRSEEQHVVQRLSAFPRGLHEDAQLADDPFLPDIVFERLGSQRLLDPELFGFGSSGEDVALAGHGAIVAAPGGRARKGG